METKGEMGLIDDFWGLESTQIKKWLQALKNSDAKILGTIKEAKNKESTSKAGCRNLLGGCHFFWLDDLVI